MKYCGEIRSWLAIVWSIPLEQTCEHFRWWICIWKDESPRHAAIFQVMQNHRLKQYVKVAKVTVCIEMSK